MSLRNLLLASVALVAALAAYLLLNDPPPAPSMDVEREVVRAVDPVEDAEVELVEAEGAGAAAERRDAMEAAVVEGDELDHPWAALLAGVTGRIVEEDGTPVVAIRVELLEGDLGILLDPEFTAMGHEGLTAGESRTDADGRFLIEGANFNGLHAFAIDGGGGRSAIRIMEHGLEPGLRSAADRLRMRCSFY